MVEDGREIGVGILGSGIVGWVGGGSEPGEGEVFKVSGCEGVVEVVRGEIDLEGVEAVKFGGEGWREDEG